MSQQDSQEKKEIRPKRTVTWSATSPGDDVELLKTLIKSLKSKNKKNGQDDSQESSDDEAEEVVFDDGPPKPNISMTPEKNTEIDNSEEKKKESEKRASFRTRIMKRKKIFKKTRFLPKRATKIKKNAEKAKQQNNVSSDNNEVSLDSSPPPPQLQNTEFKSIIIQEKSFCIGDIVYVRDSDVNKIFYAQINCFLCDQYSKYYAGLRWIVPRISSYQNMLDVPFDPEFFEDSFQEEQPVSLADINFVMSAPKPYLSFNPQNKFNAVQNPSLNAVKKDPKILIIK